jgi:hypothetical protein
MVDHFRHDGRPCTWSRLMSCLPHQAPMSLRVGPACNMQFPACLLAHVFKFSPPPSPHSILQSTIRIAAMKSRVAYDQLGRVDVFGTEVQKFVLRLQGTTTPLPGQLPASRGVVALLHADSGDKAQFIQLGFDLYARYSQMHDRLTDFSLGRGLSVRRTTYSIRKTFVSVSVFVVRTRNTKAMQSVRVSPFTICRPLTDRHRHRAVH